MGKNARLRAAEKAALKAKPHPAPGARIDGRGGTSLVGPLDRVTAFITELGVLAKHHGIDAVMAVAVIEPPDSQSVWRYYWTGSRGQLARMALQLTQDVAKNVRLDATV